MFAIRHCIYAIALDHEPAPESRLRWGAEQRLLLPGLHAFQQAEGGE